jgi:hypothetical protein
MADERQASSRDIVPGANTLLSEFAKTLRTQPEGARQILTPEVLAELRDQTILMRQLLGRYPSLRTETPNRHEAAVFAEGVRRWIQCLNVVNLALLDIYDTELAAKARGIGDSEATLVGELQRRFANETSAIAQLSRTIPFRIDHSAPSLDDRETGKQLSEALHELYLGSESLRQGPKPEWYLGPRVDALRKSQDDRILVEELTPLLAQMEVQLADFVRRNWSPKDAAETARGTTSSLSFTGPVHVGDSYSTSVTRSHVGAVVSGPGAKSVVTGSVHELPIRAHQAEHREVLAAAQGALLRDQDVLDKVDPAIFDALNQFLRMAREIQVENKEIADVQSKMKATLDDVWTQHAAKGMKSTLIPNTLEVVKALAASPAMAEVAKKLVGL